MRVRGFLWRTAGSRAGQLLPGPVHAYHEVVTRSLVRALLGDPDVVAVYAHGSYATGELRPGRSDIDLVAVVADHDVEGELALLARLGKPYRRHQAVLPLDLAVLPLSTFRVAAGRLAQRRGRIGAPGPMVPVARWSLLGGQEVRDGVVVAAPSLWYLTEAHVAGAVHAARTGADVRSALGALLHDVRREGLDWPAARRLLAATDDAELIAAALSLTDAQRELIAVPSAPRVVEGWAAPAAPYPGSLAGVAFPGPATLHRPPLGARPELVVEGGPEALARWAVAGGAHAAARAGADLRLATPRLAEEGWRGGLRAASLLLASTTIAGPPLADRVRLPEAEVLREHAAAQAEGLLADARATLLGRRGGGPQARLPETLAAWRVLARGGPLLGEEGALRAAVGELAEPGWGRRALAVGRA
jgi:predicted nucleotidyltransferase